MNNRKVQASMIAAIVLLATFGTASAQEAAKPAVTGLIFSNTGPDAAAYYGMTGDIFALFTSRDLSGEQIEEWGN